MVHGDLRNKNDKDNKDENETMMMVYIVKKGSQQTMKVTTMTAIVLAA